MLVLGLGLTIGLQHAFEPDHLSAIGTQISKNKTRQKSNSIKSTITKSSILGAFWGAGHATTLVIMGIIVYGFAITISHDIFSTFEIGVGLMLLVLGISAILNKKIIKMPHRHPHQHNDGSIHFESHSHDQNHSHSHKAYAIGLVHGLAGSGSLVVLTAATLGNIELAIGFIAIFAIGSLIGMSLVSGLLGLPFLFSNKFASIQKIFRYFAGAIALVIGSSIIYQITTLNLI